LGFSFLGIEIAIGIEIDAVGLFANPYALDFDPDPDPDFDLDDPNN
jgi:hypothetical protein